MRRTIDGIDSRTFRQGGRVFFSWIFHTFLLLQRAWIVSLATHQAGRWWTLDSCIVQYRSYCDGGKAREQSRVGETSIGKGFWMINRRSER